MFILMVVAILMGVVHGVWVGVADPAFRSLPDFFPKLGLYHRVNANDYAEYAPAYLPRTTPGIDAYWFKTNDGAVCHWEAAGKSVFCYFPQLVGFAQMFPDYFYRIFIDFYHDPPGVSLLDPSNYSISYNEKVLPVGSYITFVADISRSYSKIPAVITCVSGYDHLFACAGQGTKDVAGFVFSPQGYRLFGKIIP